MITVICSSIRCEDLKYDRVPPIIRQTNEGPVAVRSAGVEKTYMTFTIEMVGPGEMTKEQAFAVCQQIMNEVSSVEINF